MHKDCSIFQQNWRENQHYYLLFINVFNRFVLIDINVYQKLNIIIPSLLFLEFCEKKPIGATFKKILFPRVIPPYLYVFYYLLFFLINSYRLFWTTALYKTRSLILGSVRIVINKIFLFSTGVIEIKLIGK